MLGCLGEGNMTPAELSACLRIIRWTPDTLAQALECDISLVLAWLEDIEPVPVKVDVWLKVAATAHKAIEAERPKSLKGKRYTRH